MRLLAACLLIAAAMAQNEWPQFRGPEASGIAAAGPLKWNGESGEGVLWKQPVPGLGHSSPVIWGNRIFVTSAVPESGQPVLKVGLYGDIAPVPNEGAQKLKLFCYDRKTGKLLWEQTAFSGEPKVKRHPKSTHANPSAATDGKYVAALFGSEGLYVYDMDGKLVWKKDLGTLDAGFYMVPPAQWGFASSPVIHSGKLIVQADVQKDSFLAAFDVASGKELWRSKREDVPTFGTPAVAPYTAPGGPKLQVVVNGWKHIAGYDLESGIELWRARGGGDIPVPTPVVSGNLVILTHAHAGRRIMAVRTSAAGNLEENKAGLAWQVDRTGNYMQTPLLHQGLGYFCYDNGVLSVFNLETGEQVYQQRIGAGNSGYSASPVAADGRLYVTNEDGKTYVLALGREYKVLAENEAGEPVMATPALAGGVLYIRGRNHLMAIGATN